MNSLKADHTNVGIKPFLSKLQSSSKSLRRLFALCLKIIIRLGTADGPQRTSQVLLDELCIYLVVLT